MTHPSIPVGAAWGVLHLPGFRLSRSGRFFGEIEIPDGWQLNASLPHDTRMWRQDVMGSIAYASALGRVGLLSTEKVSPLRILLSKHSENNASPPLF